jgi:hypothetical protein
MKFNVINLIFCLAACALFCTCSKDKLSPLEQLPPITSRGANTFGCLLNGEAVVFTDPKQISYGLKADYDSLGELPLDSNDMWLVFENKSHVVNIFLNNPLVDSIWSLNFNTEVYPSILNPSNYIMIDSKISSSSTEGFFRSKFLKGTLPIFSGTFEFECIKPKACETLKVTHGRLDLDLRDLQ